MLKRRFGVYIDRLFTFKITKLLFENTNIFIEAINHYFKKDTVS